jgi:hypothetical protein
MYVVDNRRKNHRKRNVVLSVVVCFLLFIVIGTSFVGKKFLHANTVLRQSTTVISTVAPQRSSNQTFNMSDFTFKLPISWQQVAGETTPYHIYRFEGGVGSPDEKQLEIYQDTIPQTFPVNKVLAVTSVGNQLGAIGEVSDNCANFTKSTSAIATSSGTPAKWLNTSFLCDLNNTERDVVGTSSTTGINTVTLSGPQSGNHTFFFCFTDNSIAPDYTDFYTALSSFRVK